MVAVAALLSLDELRRYVHQALCAHDHLDPSQTPLHEAPIARRGRPCGLLFQIDGPRLVQSSALWAADEHRLLLYDSSGQRFAEVRLSEAPDPNGEAVVGLVPAL